FGQQATILPDPGVRTVKFRGFSANTTIGLPHLSAHACVCAALAWRNTAVEHAAVCRPCTGRHCDDTGGGSGCAPVRAVAAGDNFSLATAGLSLWRHPHPDPSPVCGRRGHYRRSPAGSAGLAGAQGATAFTGADDTLRNGVNMSELGEQPRASGRSV